MSFSFLTTISLIFGLFLGSPMASAEEFSLESLPVQDGGRIKPLLTYAEETLQLLHGRKSLKSANGGEKQSALRVLATWFLVPTEWDSKEFIVVNHLGLKKSMGFAADKKYYAFIDLINHPRLNTLFADLESRQANKEKLNPYYQAVSRLRNQLDLFVAIRQGALPVFPADAESETKANWRPLFQLPEETKKLFLDIMSSFAKTFVSPDPVARQSAETDLSRHIEQFTGQARQVADQVEGAHYPEPQSLAMEVFYQKHQPFFWTWVLYLLAFLTIGLGVVFKVSLLPKLGMGLAVLGFIAHTLGFLMRVVIVGRPPVSNMYETVIWVAWGTIVFAAFLFWRQRKPFTMLSGLAVATLCMIVSHLSPVILDPTLQPLEPVLRSNMWLLIHVMTITLSYAAFFLALGVGDYGLFLSVVDGNRYKKNIRELSQSCYVLLQIGVVLLAAGTILGGVWADYSWGRFWGWDPKETWAFIALMGYLAILHARLTGVLRDIGTLAGSVVAFSLVIMAWYGVNFVLGAGLHSYGFGAGGSEYVYAFVGVHLVFVAYALAVHKGLIAKNLADKDME